MVDAKWRVRRVAMFPEITDWKDPQDQYRNETDIRKLKWKYWLWFHPSAFKLIHFGTPVIATLMFSGVALFFYTRGKTNVAIFFCIICLFFIYDIFKSIKNRKLVGNRTFYDTFMREDED